MNLIIYYTRTNNTEKIATVIKELVGGDIVKINTVLPYPSSYNELIEQAKKEINSNNYPQIVNKINDLDKYDTIFIGSPNWWSTLACPVTTFLKEHDLRNKKIIPFFTHGGGSIGNMKKDLISLCPNSKILNELYVYGDGGKNINTEISNWLKQ